MRSLTPTRVTTMAILAVLAAVYLAVATAWFSGGAPAVVVVLLAMGGLSLAIASDITRPVAQTAGQPEGDGYSPDAPLLVFRTGPRPPRQPWWIEVSAATSESLATNFIDYIHGKTA